MEHHKNRTLSVLGLSGYLFVVLAGTASLWAQSSEGNESALVRLSGSFESLSEQVGPAVVQIFATGYNTTLGNTESSLLSREQSSGSGVILDPEGFILTNAHVVQGARRVQVLLARSLRGTAGGASLLKPRGKMVEAQIVGIDHETDLAVLRIPDRELPFLELGDSDELKQGQLVLAFGSPFGLENSVTLGVVSSVARQFQPEDPVVYIQTDAPINPGNSGGPLVDAHGKVMGINTFIVSQSGGNEGVGFAVPSNIAKSVFTQIRSTGRVARGEIGVYAQTVTATLAEGLGLSQEWGVVLGDVLPGKPADMTGLKVGDLILSLNGKIMENGRQFDVNLYGHSIGDLVSLEVLRGSQKLTFRVRVIEREDDFGHLLEMITPENSLVPKPGILGLDIDGQIAKILFPPRKLGGVLIAARSPGSPYWQAEFLPGDVIFAINGKEITSLASLRSRLAELQTGDPVVVQVQRQETLRFIAFEIE